MIFSRRDTRVLNLQYGHCDSLEQIAVIHLFDMDGVEFYLLNMAEDETEAWAIVNMPTEIKIELLDNEEFAFIKNLIGEEILIDKEFLPIKAKHIWQKLKKQRACTWSLQ